MNGSLSKRKYKEITKIIVRNGIFGRKPGEGWVCDTEIDIQSPIGVSSEHLQDPSRICFGQADNWFDLAIEYCLESMLLQEESIFNIHENPTTLITLKIFLKNAIEKPYIFEWSDEEKLDQGTSCKARGVLLFKEHKIRQAYFKFSKALKMLIIMNSNYQPEQDPHMQSLRMDLYNNLAACQLHFKNYSRVVELCDKSLDISSNVKGFYRRALANIEMKDYEEAEDDLKALLTLEPENTAAVYKLAYIKKIDGNNRLNYNRTIQKMFTL